MPVSTRSKQFTLVPDSPFSLSASAAFGFGPNTGRPRPDDNSMRLAFVADDMANHCGVYLVQEPDGSVTAEVQGEAAITDVEAQVARVLCLDHPGAEWLAVGERDPVMGGLQRQHYGFRPVLFHSPYEAAAWSVISARRRRAQAATVRNRIAEAVGRRFELGGQAVHAFPLPEDLLGLGPVAGLGSVQVERLHAVARAALEGQLAPARLLAMAPDEALDALREIPGIGPTYATLILLRSTGTTDVLTLNEPRLSFYAAHFYGRGPGPLDPGELEQLADRWRPFRTWAAVLLRVAGDRLGLATSV